MARLIDATRIEQYILNNCSDNEEINAIYAEIINAPTVDAEIVRYGHWINRTPRAVSAFCSACGHIRLGNGAEFCNENVPYCENCGARMVCRDSRGSNK